MIRIQFENGEGALDASNYRKSAVQQVDRDAMVDELKNRRGCNATSSDGSALIGSSGASGRVIFKFRSQLWTPFLTLEKNTQLQIGRSNSIVFFFCFVTYRVRKKAKKADPITNF